MIRAALQEQLHVCFIRNRDPLTAMGEDVIQNVLQLDGGLFSPIHPNALWKRRCIQRLYGQMKQQVGVLDLFSALLGSAAVLLA